MIIMIRGHIRSSFETPYLYNTIKYYNALKKWKLEVNIKILISTFLKRKMLIIILKFLLTNWESLKRFTTSWLRYAILIIIYG